MPKPRKSRQTSHEDKWDGDIQGLKFIGSGVSGLVFAIDERRVAKIASGTTRSIQDIDTERSIYRKLKQKRKKVKCGYILKCHETDNPRGLVLERCEESVRSRIQSSSPLPLELSVRWAREAAEGLAYIHDCEIIQGDGQNPTSSRQVWHG